MLIPTILMKTKSICNIYAVVLMFGSGTIMAGCTQSAPPQAEAPSPTPTAPASSPIPSPTPAAPTSTQPLQAQAPQSTSSPSTSLAPTSGDRGKIEFAAGSSSATVEGDLAGKEMAQYTFDAVENQTATITITSPNQAVLLTLVSPSGSPIQRYQSGLSSWSGTLPESGTYRVSAFATQASDYKLNVAISPKKSS